MKPRAAMPASTGTSKWRLMGSEERGLAGPAEAAGGKEAAGLTSEREWKAATGAAKVGRWLASIPQPAPPRSAYVSFVPPVTLLEKLLLLRSVPAERVAIGKLTAGSWQSVTQPLDEGKVQTDADCPDAAGYNEPSAEITEHIDERTQLRRQVALMRLSREATPDRILNQMTQPQSRVQPASLYQGGTAGEGPALCLVSAGVRRGGVVASARSSRSFLRRSDFSFSAHSRSALSLSAFSFTCRREVPLI
ncbi:MAG: hypothetical protein FRX49_00732 [Trebouxia sp. A1-2]|nr:MAG: hypothetical protein FRX49_00732 [Trebouxia sp. A1-2]